MHRRPGQVLELFTSGVQHRRRRVRIARNILFELLTLGSRRCETNGNTILQADVNGNSTADLAIVLTGVNYI
jgi:hypothetical protein